MAQAGRDPIFWACLTVGAQDSVWAVGRPNATDICARCPFPEGWLEGRSEPTNASNMKAGDFDGVQCDVCHRTYDPFFAGTYQGMRDTYEHLGAPRPMKKWAPFPDVTKPIPRASSVEEAMRTRPLGL